ncbi:MAG: chromosome segregation protein SMC [Bacillota bacterium]
MSARISIVGGWFPLHLKSISIWGFKSFAVRTNIQFCDGLSVIVGSNGSGKSNIADAIWWGLGQQNPRLLRASRAEQLIFSGSATRPPLSVAEVALVLQGDHSEVGLVRRVTRDGDSEYFVNGKKCRLKDFINAVSNCNVHPDSLVVISQGKTDEFLSMSPQQRKQVMEQMAGLTIYRVRRDEALRLLTDAEAKLVRVLDLRSELEARKGQLATAAQTARLYRETKYRLDMLEAAATVYELRCAKERREQALLDATRIREKMAGVEAELAQQEDALQGCEARKQEIQSKLEQVKVELGTAEQRLAQVYRDAALCEQKLIALSGEIQRLEGEAASEEEAACRLSKEVAAGQVKLDSLAQAAVQKRLEAQALEGQEIPTLLEALEDRVKALEGKRNELFDLLNRRASLRNSAATAERDIERNAKQVARLCQELDVTAQRRQKVADRLGAMDAELAKLSEALASAEEQRQRGEQEAAQIERCLAELERKRAVLVSETTRLKSRLSVLQGVIDSLEDFSPGTRAVLRAVREGILKHIHGALGQLIQVSDGFETAVDIGLGSALQFVVVDSVSAAEAAIQFLKRADAGRCTFLPIDTVKGFRFTSREEAAIAKHPEVKRLVDVIQVPDQFRVCLEHVAGRVAVVPDVDTALALGRETGFTFKIVTVEGELFNPGGSLTGGRGRESGLTQRRAEIKRVQHELERKKAELALLESALAEAKAKARTLGESQSKLVSEISSIKLRLASARAELQEGRRSLHELEQRALDLSADAERLGAENERLKQCLEVVKEELRSTETAERQLRRIIADLDKDHAQLQQMLQAASARLASAKAEAESVERQIELLSERFSSLAGQAASLRQSAEGKRERAKALQGERASLQAYLEGLRREQVELESKKEALCAEEEALSKSLVALEDEATRINRTCRTLRAGQTKLSSSLAEAEVLLRQAEMEVELLERKLSALPAVSEGVPRQLVADEIADLERKISDMGEVNLLAEREYQELCSRVDDLERQIDDINCSKKDLYKLLNRIDAEMDRRYADTFETVRNEFRSTFVELFEGGHADLVPSEEGVELIVVPPGRKIKEMVSLSGGEKAMTGISALFAMARVNPSPFYVLDEVDAALDDVNLGKFLRYLTKASQRTQFIVITHQKLLMEAADALYGVTLEEPGVSRLVSVRLKEA